LYFLYSACSSFWVVKDDKRLSLCFEIGFGNEVDDIAVFGEDFSEGFFKGVGFYALFEVFDGRRLLSWVDWQAASAWP